MPLLPPVTIATLSLSVMRGPLADDERDRGSSPLLRRDLPFVRRGKVPRERSMRAEYSNTSEAIRCETAIANFNLGVTDVRQLPARERPRYGGLAPSPRDARDRSHTWHWAGLISRQGRFAAA